MARKADTPYAGGCVRPFWGGRRSLPAGRRTSDAGNDRTNVTLLLDAARHQTGRKSRMSAMARYTAHSCAADGELSRMR
jgi:hypothetical protein